MLNMKKKFLRYNITSNVNNLLKAKYFSSTQKFLLLNNTPNHWNESFIEESFSKTTNLEYIKKINSGLDFNSDTNNRNSQESTFVIKLNKFVEKDLVQDLSKMLSNYKDLKIELCNDLNINQVNLTQSINYKNLILVYSKDTNTNLSEFKDLESFIIENKENIRIKTSSSDNYLYVWFKEETHKSNFYKLLENHKEKLFYCESKSHYPLTSSNEKKGINFTSSDKEDVKLLKEINNRIEVLNCSEQTPKNKNLKQQLLSKKKTLMSVLREKEALPYIKPYTVVGSSGILLYNF
jgi:hypothetical protein